LLYDDVAAEAKAALASLGFPGTSTPAGPVDLSVTGASGKHLAVRDGAVKDHVEDALEDLSGRVRVI